MNKEILNQGFAQPMQVNVRGGIRKAQGDEKIRRSILTIVGTQHGERLMRPNFGCNLKSLVFAPNNTATANLARYYVEEALRTWEPRIVLESVTVQNHQREGELLIEVRYRIKSTNESGEVAFPFDLQQP